jgi:hypothetical protein
MVVHSFVLKICFKYVCLKYIFGPFWDGLTHLKVRQWTDCIGDVGQITHDSYRPLLGQGYDNWIIKFKDGGDSWEKKRVVSAATCRVHGALEPIAFLHCFRDGVFAGSITTHRDKVSERVVASFVADHTVELEVLSAAFPS